jgi:hypothetical protein
MSARGPNEAVVMVIGDGPVKRLANCLSPITKLKITHLEWRTENPINY